jgi:hypothetical protein
MKQVDEPPAELLGVIVERCVGEQREQVGPDRDERLFGCILIDRIGARRLIERGDVEMAELQCGELGGKCGVHDGLS